jgi:hypothetical protein
MHGTAREPVSIEILSAQILFYCDACKNQDRLYVNAVVSEKRMNRFWVLCSHSEPVMQSECSASEKR